MKSRLLTKLRFMFVLLFLMFFAPVFSQTGSYMLRVHANNGIAVQKIQVN